MFLTRIAKVCLVFGIVIALANTGFGSLIGYYPMNETNSPSLNTNVADSSALGQTGKMVSDAVTGTGGVEGIPSANAGLGTAFSFSAAPTSFDYVDVNPFAGLTRDGALTYAAWIKPSATQLSEASVIASTGRGYDLRLAPSGSDWNLVLKSGTSVFSLPSAGIAPTNVWTHVAVTKDVNGSAGLNLATVKFYVNGALVDSGSIGRAVSGTPARLFIGTGALTNQYYDGGIDEAYIYNEVLDATAIAALAAVPEPTAIVLMGIGVLGLVGRRPRKPRKE